MNFFSVMMFAIALGIMVYIFMSDENKDKLKAWVASAVAVVTGFVAEYWEMLTAWF